MLPFPYVFYRNYFPEVLQNALDVAKYPRYCNCHRMDTHVTEFHVFVTNYPFVMKDIL